MRLRTSATILAFLVGGTHLPGVRGESDNDEPKVYRQLLEIANRRRLGPYVVVARDYRLCFVPPSAWGVRYDTIRRATLLLHPGLEAGISITIEQEPLAESAPPLADRLHESIRRRYPDAEISGEFKVYAAGRPGLAVEFERRIADKGVRTSFRRAMFEFEQGTVELEMVAASTRFSNYDHTYGGILNSLQVEFGMNLSTQPLPSSAAPRTTPE